MDLKARLCIELDGSITAEMYVTSYRGSKKGFMTVWKQTFATLLGKEQDMINAKAVLEEQVKKAKELLGESPTIRTYRVEKEYIEIYAEDEGEQNEL